MTNAATPPSTPPQQEVHDWLSRTVHDAEGVPLGRCTRVFSDLATDVPEWLGVALDGGERIVVVPVVDAVKHGDDVRVAVTRASAERAPIAGEGDVIAVTEEERLYRHYGITRSVERSPTGLPATGPAPTTSAPAAPTAVSDSPKHSATTDPPAHQPLVGLSTTPSTARRGTLRSRARMPLAAVVTAAAGLAAAFAARRRRARTRRSPGRVVSRLRTR